MSVAKYEFNVEKLQLIAIGDLHIGADGSYYKNALKFIDKYPESKILFIGDLIDNSIISSIGDVYSQQDNPHEALKIVQDIFRKYRKRILGVISGNHEHRTWKAVGVDPLQIICENFSIPYSKDLLVVDIALNMPGKKGRGSKNRVDYIIATHHGSAGGRFPEKSTRQSRYFSDFFENADIYISGHTHQFDYTTQTVYGYDPRNKKIYGRNATFIVIPAWLQGKYAKRKMLPPSTFVELIITLYADYEKTVEVTGRVKRFTECTV
jgi:UDP-2,3-diacylglucosamine pyrophosphatase LpxH